MCTPSFQHHCRHDNRRADPHTASPSSTSETLRSDFLRSPRSCGRDTTAWWLLGECHLIRQFFLELVPRPAGFVVVIVHIRCRAYLVDDIIVPQDMAGSDSKLPHQLLDQPNTRLLSFLREIPFRVRCKCSVAVTLAAHFDADRVVVVGLRVLLFVITSRANRPRHGIQTATLVDGAIPVDVEMCTTPIGRQVMCLADHAQIMHSNVLFSDFPMPGLWMMIWRL